MLKWEIRLTKEEMIIGQDDYLNDEVIVYNGLYGIPSYVVWYSAPDKTKTLYIGDEFRLGIYDDLKNVHWVEDYIIKKAVYDLVEKKYKIYGEAKVNVVLSKLKKIVHKIWSSNKELPLDGYEIILQTFRDKEVRAAHDLNLRVGYVQYSFDKSMHLLDILRKICRENLWEFYLRSDAIFLSEAFYLTGKHVIKAELGEQHTKIIDSFHFQHITMPADLCEPGALFGEEGRVIWVKFYLGGNLGGMMEVMVYKHKESFLSEDAFVETLSGIAYDLGKQQLSRSLKQDPVILGRIFGEYRDEHREKYISPKFSGEDKQFAKDLDNRIFETDFATKKQFLGVTDAKKTTPYAGDGVGLLFPQEETNAVLLTAQGDREFALVGPNYFGGGDEIPIRDSEKDFRLQLPGGWCLYVESGKFGRTILKPTNAMSDQIPQLGTGEMGLILDPKNDNENQEVELVANFAQGILIEDGDNGSAIIQSGTARIKINKDGTIQIITDDKDVIVNSGGHSVALDNHKHTINTHTHQVTPGPLIPGPPAQALPNSTPNTNTDPDSVSAHLRCEQG